MIATEKPKLPKLQFGEGTLAYTDTGTIAYKKYVELSDGSKVRKTVNSTSITKCIKRMRDVEEDLKTRSKPDKTQVNLKGEIYYWLENVKKNQLKTQSYNRIESIARNNIIPWKLADKRVSLITSKELQRFINELNDGDHSYSSIKKVFDCLNEFYRFVSTRDHIDNPMETVVCVSKENVIKETKEVEYLDSEDIKKFKDQALKTWDSSGKQRYRYGYVLVANLYLGLRIGELLVLKWRDVNFKGRYIEVNKTLIEEYNPRYDRNDPERMKKKNISKMIFRIQKSTKTNKNRKVPINNAAMYYLKKHYELTEYGKMNDFVIATKSGKNSNVRNIQNSIKSILKYADTKIQSSNTHIMRHTCATLLYSKGVSLHTIAKILGNSEEVLKKTYVHFNDEDLSRIMEMIADIE